MINSSSWKLSLVGVSFLLALFCIAQSGSAEGPSPNVRPINSELNICKDCPIFVRVPSAPGGMRRIMYVSKYELTWNNYLAAYDAGSCSIPNPNSGDKQPGPNDILPNLEQFRLDWPIEQLGPAEVKCYIDWLQMKTKLLVALPTGQEWEWFARAGKAGAKFPWGDTAEPNHEALFGTSVDLRYKQPIEYRKGGKYLTGVKIGLFPPNSWGLYDIMGNVRELTSQATSGEERLRQHPDDRLDRLTRDKDSVLIKGSNSYDSKWSDVGISDNRYKVIIWNGRYMANVGVRLILVESGK